VQFSAQHSDELSVARICFLPDQVCVCPVTLLRYCAFVIIKVKKVVHSSLWGTDIRAVECHLPYVIT